MKIKDFKVGQTVYLIGYFRNQKDRFRPIEAEVVKVGRKYVAISGNSGLQFEETAVGRPYLIEHTEVGEPRLLFPSKEAVDEYREREELKTWVQTAAGWDKIDRYTLDQLREVKKILEGGDKL